MLSEFFFGVLGSEKWDVGCEKWDVEVGNIIIRLNYI